MGEMYHIDLSNVPPDEKELCRNKVERSAFEVFPILGETDKFDILWESEDDISTLGLPNSCNIQQL